MAGFRITYDGSLTGRTDVPQVTGTSNSLTSLVTVSPAGWDNITSIATTLYPDAGFGGLPLIPNAWTEGLELFPQASGPTYAGGDVTMGLNDNGSNLLFISPMLTGTFDIEIRFNVPSANWICDIRKQNGSGQTRSLNLSKYTNVSTIGGSAFLAGWQIMSASSVVLNNSWFTASFGMLFSGSTQNVIVDYVRVTQTAGVNVLDSTITGGAAPTGGTGTTATPSTVVDGSAGIAGPSSPITVVAKDGANTAAKVVVEPPADSAENSSVDTTNTKIITATTTSLGASVTGLDTTNQIASAETSIQVVALEDATEN